MTPKNGTFGEARTPVLTAVATLTPASWNPRTIRDVRFKNLCASLAADPDFLWHRPIVATADGTIYGGNMRYRAAAHLGWREVPAIMEDIPVQLAKERALRDNAQWGEWQEDELAELLYGLSEAGSDMGLLGLEDKEVQQLLDSVSGGGGGEDPGAQMERAEELRAKWGAEVGQLWVIPSLTSAREHRLLCGDATDPVGVTRLMAGERATLFATDPPYLVDYDGTNHPHKWNATRDEALRKNKDWSDSYKDWDTSKQGDGLYNGFIAVAIAHAIERNAAWYCWHASRNQAMLEDVWQRHGAFVHQQIIRVKDRPILTRSWYMWQHEPCFFGWIKGAKPYRAARDYPPPTWRTEGDSMLNRVRGGDVRDGDLEALVGIAEWAAQQTTCWELDTIKPGTETVHPTMKPVEVFARPMRQHTRPGEVCYEPFSGSGTQLVAAEQQGRRCFAVELAPEYVAVALERLAGMGLSPRLADD